MSEDSGQKTEQPTQKKRQDAREKGQVAQSKELTSLSAMATIVACLSFSSNSMLDKLADNFSVVLRSIQLHNFEMSVVYGTLWQSMSVVARIIFMPIILAGVISLLINILQLKGLTLNKEFFKIDLNKLNPMKNFKNIFSVKNFIKFLKQFVEITAMAIVSFSIVKHSFSDLLIGYNIGLLNFTALCGWLIVKLFSVLFLMHLAFAIFDFVMEKRNLTKQLMMSKEDMKQEHKNSEGDPEVKQQRKELHRELLEDDSMSETISSSTLVLANPTHIAVVLLYHPKRWKLPIVVVKAKGPNAEQVFKLANKSAVPIIRDIWLARSLYKLAKVGQYIPSTYVKHVADIFNKNLELFPVLEAEINDIMAEMQKSQVLSKK
jgi:type III secretion protein U